jgi:hypothetical protein
MRGCVGTPRDRRIELGHGTQDLQAEGACEQMLSELHCC